MKSSPNPSIQDNPFESEENIIEELRLKQPTEPFRAPVLRTKSTSSIATSLKAQHPAIDRRLTVPDIIVFSKKNSGEKTQKIIDELIQTERSYLMDLKLVQDVYVAGAKDKFKPADMRVVFTNLSEVTKFSDVFLYSLEQARILGGVQITQLFIDKVLLGY